MKRKIITLGSILFMCLALVSVGFAAWVISGDAKGTAQGNVEVDTVVDKSYTMTNLTTTDGKIVFAAPSGATTGWLTSDGSKTEKLTVVFTATVSQGGTVVDFTGDSNKDNVLQAGGTKVTAEVKVDNQAYQKAVTDNLITAPTVTVEGTNQGVITVTVTVAWGSAFGSENPFNYYANKEQAQYQSEAITRLQTLEKLSSVVYNLNVTVTQAK